MLLLASLNHDGDAVIVARGGRGGLGNRRDAPREWGAPASWCQSGGLPEEASILLDRRVLADVALVGAPNAGKSSLLRALTAARPHVAPYAFTTLTPQVGALVGEVSGHWLKIADMPGLVEGANEDRGLGIDFLKCAQKLLPAQQSLVIPKKHSMVVNMKNNVGTQASQWRIGAGTSRAARYWYS